MNFINTFIIGFLCACSFSSVVCAEGCRDSVFLSKIDWEDLVESEYGEFFLEINNELHLLDALYFEDGCLYLETGAHANQDNRIFKCPCVGCGRLQTVALLKQNNMWCSGCKRYVYTCAKYKGLDGNL
jgi:hypothetical protein